MDFSFTDTQRSLAELAERIFSDAGTPDRLKEVEASAERFDRVLWDDLAKAGLLGGHGIGVLEMCVLLEAQGRAVTSVPLWTTLVASLVDPLDGIVSCAIAEPASDDPLRPGAEVTQGRLSGVKCGVPAAHLADGFLVTTRDGVVSAAPSEIVDERSTSGERLGTVTFADVPCTAVDVSVDRFVQLATVALCALQVGVAERALRMTAEYTTGREQFERPLATFQAVQQRAGDAYVDVEAMRWTMWQAAWRLHEGLDAADAVDIAKFWVSEGGQRVVSSAQHLHGGVGVDLDYPLHRYTLWAKQIELSLGAATARLARIGDRIAEGALGGVGEGA